MADPSIKILIRHRALFGHKIRIRRPKAWLFPHNAERELQNRILKTVDVIETLTKSMVFPVLKRLVDQASRIRGDAWSDDLDNLQEQLRNRVDFEAPDEEQSTTIAAKSISDFNNNEWRAIIKKALGIDIFTQEPWLRDELRSWSKETANLITTLEDDAVKQVSIWTNKGIRQGWRWEDIAKNIEDRFDVSRNRARFIARDQTAKLNGELTKRRQTQSGVTHYFWRDSRDERVRGNPDGLYPKAKPSHWDRNGKRYAWDDPPEGGPPGFDFQCRCTGEPDLSGLLESIDEE